MRMRNISLFALILFSTSLLSDSCQAIGIYGARTVRRSDDSYLESENRFNKRYPAMVRGLQERAAEVPQGKQSTKVNVKGQAPPPTTKGILQDGANGNGKSNPANQGVNQGVGNQGANQGANRGTNQGATNQGANQGGNKGGSQEVYQVGDQSPPPQGNTISQGQSGNGTPSVSTSGPSTPAMIGLVCVGGVFVVVAGLFAFSQRKRNKEMTESIVSTSARAWEKQNSTLDAMEDETEPIGSYTVIATYTPNLADELDIQPGDKVTILVEYDDGWVQGINETRGGAKGVFPRHCVDMGISFDKHDKRSSSLGGYTGGYTEVDLS